MAMMTTAAYLASDPFAVLHFPRVKSLALSKMEHAGRKIASWRSVEMLIAKAQAADGQMLNGASYHDDEAGYDARVAANNAACIAVLAAIGEEYN